MAERSSTEVTMMRHGPKRGERLDPERIVEVKHEADVYFDKMLAALPDSVFFIIPSGVQRSQDTRQVMEDRIRELLQKHSESNIEIVPDAESAKTRKGNGKKYLIAGVQPDRRLGFIGWRLISGEMDRLLKIFQGEEEYTARTWIARASEIDELKADILKRFPDISTSELATIRPASFKETPEEKAINDLEAVISDIEQIAKDHPGQPLFGTFVGHASRLDFLTMGVLTENMTLANFKRSQGLRKYLEASNFKVENGMIVEASFRGRSLAAPIAVSEVIARLRKASKERKAEWEKV